jgi:hypothetical protein
MDGTLLMTHQNVPDAVFEVAERVIYGYDLSSRISEYCVNPFGYEGKPHRF